MIEAINYIEKKLRFKIKIKFIKNRVGDHIWYISDINKFKDHYPQWKPKVFKKIMDKLIFTFDKSK